MRPLLTASSISVVKLNGSRGSVSVARRENVVCFERPSGESMRSDVSAGT